MTHEASSKPVCVHEATRVVNGRTIVTNASLEVEAGQVALLSGVSGSGKSTVLRMVKGVDEPSSGRVELFGTDLATLSKKQKALMISQRIGMVFQHPGVSGNFSVIDNMTGTFRERGQKPDYTAIASILGYLGLYDNSEKLQQKAHTLSGGEQQRLAIAKVLARGPELLLLDEPTSSQDMASRTTIYQAIGTFSKEQGVAALIVAHDREAALAIADVEYVMRDGRIIDTILY